jgi:hypothetical protein
MNCAKCSQKLLRGRPRLSPSPKAVALHYRYSVTVKGFTEDKYVCPDCQSVFWFPHSQPQPKEQNAPERSLVLSAL